MRLQEAVFGTSKEQELCAPKHRYGSIVQVGPSVYCLMGWIKFRKHLFGYQIEEKI